MNESTLWYYEELERASASMLEAAQAGDWQQVIRLGEACVALLIQLKQVLGRRPPAQQETEKQTELLGRILANDAAIRALMSGSHRSTLDPYPTFNSNTLH